MRAASPSGTRRLHHVQSGVRPERPRAARWRSTPRPTPLYVQDQWRLNDRLLAEPRPPVRLPAAAPAWRIETDGVSFVGNPAFPQTTEFQQGQEELGAPARRDLRPRRQARHGGPGRLRALLRPDQQQRGRQRLAEQRDQSMTYSFTPTTAGAPIYPDVLTALPQVAPARGRHPNYFASDLVRPRVHSTDLASSAAVSNDITVTVSYLNSRGRNLPYFRDINFGPANSTVNYVLVDGELHGQRSRSTVALVRTRHFGRITVMESTVDTDYNALVLEARKRFSDGLLFNVNYTLAKSEDNGQTSTTFFSSNQAYRRARTARANGVRQRHVRRRTTTGGIVSSAASTSSRTTCGASASAGSSRSSRGLPTHPANQRRLLPAGVGSVFSSSTNGTGGSYGRAVARVQQRPPDGPQDLRHPRGEGVPPRWHGQGCRSCGKSSTSSTP